MSVITTVAGRTALEPRREPYWKRVSSGCYVGVRKMTTANSGTWLARCFDPSTGKQQYSALGDFSDLPDHQRFDAASKKAAAWFDHIGRGGLNVDVTVKEVCVRYCDSLTNAGKPAAAKDAARRFAVYVTHDERLAQTPVQKLTRDNITQWRKRLCAAPVAAGHRVGELRTNSSLNRDMTPFRAALNLALADGLVTSPFAWEKPLTPIKDADGQRDVYLDLVQRRTLASHAPDDLKAFIHASMLLPIRPGALAKLTVGDFDRRRGVLRIGQDKTGARTIALPTDTIAHLTAQCVNKLPTAPLFSRATGGAWEKDAWKKPFKAAAKMAGLGADITLYAFRHSVITDLVNAGSDLLLVSQLAGTSTRMIEKHYGHLIPGRGATALKVLTL